ncbi:MAG: hypothetical protein RIS63_279, partial [Bacteroidota bacterium]
MSVVQNHTPTVLIAGGSGLIGSALTQHLEARGFRVFKLTRSATQLNHLFWDPQANQIDTT